MTGRINTGPRSASLWSPSHDHPFDLTGEAALATVPDAAETSALTRWDALAADIAMATRCSMVAQVSDTFMGMG